MPASFRVSGSIVHEKFDDETVIVNLDSGCYYNLQGCADRVWTLVAAGCSEPVIVEEICRGYEGSPALMTAATLGFLNHLAIEQLVERCEGEGAAAPAAGASAASPFVVPVLQKFTDMEELLRLDPIHEVDKLGWPSKVQRPA
ncbi:MAG: PqqD family protein [Nevskia sp.]|nr:PqqD family protein [Nevskia sp.]